MSSCQHAVDVALSTRAISVATLGSAAPQQRPAPRVAASSCLREFEHWHYDTFRVIWRNRLLGKSMATFAIDGMPKVAAMKIENLGDFLRGPAKTDAASANR
jgi:hypothetical protein